MTNNKMQTVSQAIQDCLKDGGNKAKNLFKGKIIAATALTLATFFLLTKTKQKNTKNTVIKEIKQKMDNPFNEIPTISEPEIFSDIADIAKNNETKKNKKTQTFKGAAKSISEAIMFNPVHNMKLIDAGITTERLACSRNKTEFCEHAIKEGGFLFFIYGFGNLVEKGINKFSSKVLKKPIDLSIDVLMDEKLTEALSKGKIISDAAKLPAKDKSLTEKLNFVLNNPDNIIVQAAKKSKIVSTVRDKSGNIFVDTSKYIDPKAIEELAENLTNLDKNFKISNEPVKKFLNKTKGLKVGSVMANIGISCFVLGYLIPKLVYKYREMKTGTTKFHVAEDIKKNNRKDLNK